MSAISILIEARQSSAENDGASDCGSSRCRPRMASNVAHSRFESLALEVILASQNLRSLLRTHRTHAYPSTGNLVRRYMLYPWSFPFFSLIQTYEGKNVLPTLCSRHY